jgi:hypothetical protein
MYIDDLNLRIVFQEFAEFGNINIHAAGIEIIIIDPDRL